MPDREICFLAVEIRKENSLSMNGETVSWGNIQIQFHVDEGMIQDVNVFSDAMDQEMIGMLAEQLKGCAYAEEDICRAVKAAERTRFRQGNIRARMNRSHAG